MDNINLNSLSVVIPTLGGKSLLTVINLLNDGNDIPSEILVCIPDKYSKNIKLDNFPNVKIIKTPVIGQVFQRIEGFKKAKEKFVLQLDDDCKISNYHVKKLLNKLNELGPGNSIAPIYFDEKTGVCSHSYRKGLKGFITNLIATFICGAPWGLKRMGCISKVGTNYGVDVKYMNNDTVETEWVPGGCFMHFKETIYLENFFPFKGKAFCEDLMHSHLLRKNNVKLWVTKYAECRTKHAYFPNKKNEILQYLKAYKYLYYMREKKVLRFWLWYFLNILRQWIRYNIETEKNTDIKIGIEINRISYTPEAYAYAHFLTKKGFIVDLNYKEQLKNNNDLTIHFMGFRPFWNNFIFKRKLEIHEYTSLSTAPFAKIKDRLKYHLNLKPVARIFMNSYIKETFGFNNNIPYIYREMGANSDMFIKLKNTIEYDLVYSGSIEYRPGLLKEIEKLASLDFKIILIGYYNQRTYNKFKKYKNVKLIGRVERIELPKYYSKCKAGLNFTPNIYPLNLQSSTKTIEYCAAGLYVISSKYEWIKNFEKERSAKFLWIDEISKKSDFENYKFKIPDVSDLEWNNILEKSSFDKFIRNSYLNN